MPATLWWALVAGLITPAVMIACYPVFMAQSRRSPNRWSGYRTERALSSARSWREAQVLCARLWVQIGAGFALLTLVGFGILLASGNRDEDTWWGLALAFSLLPLIGMLGSMVVVEKHLRSLDETEPAVS